MYTFGSNLICSILTFGGHNPAQKKKAAHKPDKIYFPLIGSKYKPLTQFEEITIASLSAISASGFFKLIIFLSSSKHYILRI